MLNEVICNSDDSEADIHEGGYEESRTAPTREPSKGWPDNTPQSIREAAAAITDPELKKHNDKVQEVLEEMQQSLRCATCKVEVEAQKEIHLCRTCQVSQCKTCIVKHWLVVKGTCAQFASWPKVQWSRTFLQEKMQKHQYKKAACEVAAEGLSAAGTPGSPSQAAEGNDHRQQKRAEIASASNQHDQPNRN